MFKNTPDINTPDINQINVNSLNNENIKRQYQRKLEKELDKAENSTDVEQQLGNIKNNVLNATKLIGEVNK